MEERATTWRTLAWAGGAAFIHAALLASLLLVEIPVWRAAPRVDPAAEAEAQAQEIELAFESQANARTGAAAAEGVAQRAEVRGDPAARGSVEAPARTRVPSSGSSSDPMSSSWSGDGPPQEPRADGAAASSAEGATGFSGGVVNPIPLSSAELGIGGRNPFLPRREEPAPVLTGRDHPAARALRGTGLGRDRELGLGPEGPGIAALSEATSSSLAPLKGRALFVIRTGGDGLVLAVDLVDSEGGSGWRDAARVALENLRGKKFAVPRGAAGLNMRIEVQSAMKLPNGENTAVGTRRGANDMPELTIPDISNIGAKPRRVVHARAVGTEVL